MHNLGRIMGHCFPGQGRGVGDQCSLHHHQVVVSECTLWMAGSVALLLQSSLLGLSCLSVNFVWFIF